MGKHKEKFKVNITMVLTWRPAFASVCTLCECDDSYSLFCITPLCAPGEGKSEKSS